MQAPQTPLLFLFATMAALLAGPLLVAYAGARPRLSRSVDRFVLVCLAALVGLEVAPESIRAGGYLSLAFMAAGLFGPTILERLFRRARRGTHMGTLALALVGLVLHALADGAVLAASRGWALPLAVVLHTLPVGMAVWWLLVPAFGTGLPLTVLALMAAGTLGGFAFGITLSELLETRTSAWLEAFVAGAILHVVFGKPHLEAQHAH